MNDPLTPPGSTAVNPASPNPPPMVNNHHHHHHNQPQPQQQIQEPLTTSSEVKSESGGDLEEELLLKWDDHHRSFFELAEDLCHQEQFIDVTLSCGDHNFPAHKLILSVCSPYFRHLFLRNPCKHPIVVLKDVHFKYMKLLLMYMYRGEVSCPQEDLAGLLRTARSLQIRGLVELERKREAEGLTNSYTGSPIKRTPSDLIDAGSTTSMESQDFSLDDVRSRLHGQLEIQPISQPSSSSSAWNNQHHSDMVSKAAATSSSGDPIHHHGHFPQPAHQYHQHHQQGLPGNGFHEAEEDHHRLPHHYQKLRKMDDPRQKWLSSHQNDHHGTDLSLPRRRPSPPSRGGGSTRGTSRVSSTANHAAQLLAAAQASSIDPNNPMSSMNALLAAAQAHSGSSSSLPVSTLSSLLPSAAATSSTSASSPSSSAANSTPPAAPGAPQPPPPPSTQGPATSAAGATSTGAANSGSNGQGVDLSQAAAVANLQLYYYMQKVASAGMGNPKERKECPICGKTLYDRSTWNRHMRIHTGEKPYPCRFCGRRFRTNYNKLGHEKKCPDRNMRPVTKISAAEAAVPSDQSTPTSNNNNNNDNGGSTSNANNEAAASASSTTTSAGSTTNGPPTAGTVYR